MTSSTRYSWNQQEHCIYLSLGSNIQPEGNIPRAVKMLNQYCRVKAVSTVWETAPVGTSGRYFLNAAVLLEVFVPSALLKSFILRRIESEMGRVRTFNKFAPRPIDLDILVADGQIIEPAIWKRAYLAVPLAELLPDITNPDSGKSLALIAQDLNQPEEIRPRNDVQIG